MYFLYCLYTIAFNLIFDLYCLFFHTRNYPNCLPSQSITPVAGVLDEPYSQLIPLSGVAGLAPPVYSLSYVAWRARKATPLSGLS